MAVKILFVIATVLAAANAGYVAPAYAPAAVGYAPVASTAVGSQSQSTIRSLDGNSVVSQYSKAVDTAYSSVRKYDTRISNDGYAVAPVAYSAPAYAAPVAKVAAPVAYAAPAYAAPAYAAPVAKVVAPAAYAAPAYAAPAYAAPVAKVVAPAAYAAPAYAAHAYAAPAYAAPVAKVAAAPALLGVAYSAAPTVAHISFDGYGTHYAY